MNDPLSQLRREQTTRTTANDNKASKTGTGKKPYEAETFFEYLEKVGLDKVAGMPGQAKIEVPLDIVKSLLRPDELEKLQKYITAYLAKHGGQ